MTTMSVPVPDSLETVLSPDWLTAALEPRFPGLRVRSAMLGPVVSRVSTNARFTIDVDGDLPAELPAELCVKGYFGADQWPARSAGQPEVSFYRDVFPSTGMRSLDCFYADIDPVTGHGVVITGDVVARGGVFLDALSDYTVEQVAESLSQLAVLHASMWRNDQLPDADWLKPHLAQTLLGRGVKEISYNFDGPIGASVPVDVRDAERLVAVYRELSAQVAADPEWTVIHGDTHIGNVFLDGAGRPSFLDWQVAQRGAWYVDVGYHIASALPVEERRANERELLAGYRERLAAAGVAIPSSEQAWGDMRRGVVHGFFLWGITQRVNPAITTVLLERLGTAVSDHGSYELIG